MTPSAGNSISVNVFECNSKTMLSAASSRGQGQEKSFLALRVRFLLYLADSRLLKRS
jgi:hypothetical protein